VFRQPIENGDTPGRKIAAMKRYMDEELEDNALGLEHRDLGLFDQVVNDVTVDHPDTKAYYDGRKGIDYTELDDDSDDSDEADVDEDD
jgi:hypothetical protein